MSNTVKNPLKKVEYEAFVKLLKEGIPTQSWAMIAQALGVDADTISRWKKLPEAKKAISKGLQMGIEQMVRAGKNDWRMWERYLEMNGAPVKPTRLEGPNGGPIKLETITEIKVTISDDTEPQTNQETGGIAENPGDNAS